MKHLLLKFYASNDSSVNRWLTGFITSVLTAVVTVIAKKLGLEISDELTGQISIGSGVLVSFFLAEWVAKEQAAQAKTLQEVVNNVETRLVPTVEPDGRIGDKTINAVKNMVHLINNSPAKK